MKDNHVGRSTIARAQETFTGRQSRALHTVTIWHIKYEPLPILKPLHLQIAPQETKTETSLFLKFQLGKILYTLRVLMQTML